MSLYLPRELKGVGPSAGVYRPIDIRTDDESKIVMAQSEWTQRILNLRVQGQTVPFSLDERDYVRPVYDNGYRRIVMLTGRQVEKTTTLAAKLFGWMTKIPNFKAIYAGPDDHTIKTFSESRLYDFIDSSPLLSEYYMKGHGTVRNVGAVKLCNGSGCYLKNAARQGSNFRGLSAEAFLVDEMQGMDEEVMPVGRECLSHGKMKIEMYCGTPLTMHNFAQKQWKRSTQNEWLIPCPHCHGALSAAGAPNGRHQYYINIGIPNITPMGLICDKCGALVDSRTGSWIRMQPHKRIEGFRIPQPIGSWVDMSIVYYEKLMEYSLARFQNEVLGISCDSSALFLTEAEVYTQCKEHLVLKEERDSILKGRLLVAGIDWGHQNVENGGTTTLVIFAIDPNTWRMEMVYGRIYPHTMSKMAQTQDIIKRLATFKISIACCDLGANGDRNERIASAIGSDRVVQIHYVGGSSYVKYHNVTGIFRVGKTVAMSTFYTDFTLRGMVHLVNREQFEPFAEQMLGAGKEIDHQGNLKYVKMDGEDDFLQSTIYANMGRRILMDMELVDHIPLAEEHLVRNSDVNSDEWDGTMPNWDDTDW